MASFDEHMFWDWAQASEELIVCKVPGVIGFLKAIRILLIVQLLQLRPDARLNKVSHITWVSSLYPRGWLKIGSAGHCPDHGVHLAQQNLLGGRHGSEERIQALQMLAMPDSTFGAFAMPLRTFKFASSARRPLQAPSISDKCRQLQADDVLCMRQRASSERGAFLSFFL